MDVYRILEEVRKQKPLVHHITNWVTISDCADIVKAFGASPVMAHAQEEVAEMAQLSSALVLNIGTLTVSLVESMKVAGKAANQKKIPVILDVCGAGATSFRSEQCASLMKEIKVDIIKGNASEIATIAGYKVQTKGVETSSVTENVQDLACRLAVRQDVTVVVTGPEDIVADQKRRKIIKNGDSIMGQIVGTGCMSSSVIGAFAAVEKDFIQASCAGLCCYEIAAERAAQKSKSPASFKQNLLEEVYRLEETTISRMQRIF